MANIDLSKFGGKPVARESNPKAVDHNKAEQAVEQQNQQLNGPTFPQTDPNLTPPAVNDPPNEPGVQGSGPSGVATGSPPVEPKAPTRPIAPIADPDGGSAVTDLDPPPMNPRISGGSDVFSPASDPFKRTGDMQRAMGVEEPNTFRDTSKIKGRNKKTGQVLVQDGGTLKWVDEKQWVTAPVTVEKEEDPDFIDSAIPFEGQSRGDGEKRYAVQLVGEPREYIFAKDRLEAQVRYNRRLGIISTLLAYNITEAEVKVSNDNSRNIGRGESEPTK